MNLAPPVAGTNPTNQAQALGAWTPVAINGQNVVVGGHSVAGALAPAWWTAGCSSG